MNERDFPGPSRDEANTASFNGLRGLTGKSTLPMKGEVMKKFSTSDLNDNAAHRVTVIGIDLAKNVFALQRRAGVSSPITTQAHHSCRSAITLSLADGPSYRLRNVVVERRRIRQKSGDMAELVS
jgi:hypothetical protein